MAWYMYWQATPDSEWNLALADAREGVVNKHAPPFTTVLDLDTEVNEDEFSAEDFAKIKYRGGWYLDFDGESIEEVVPQFHKFLQMLQDKGVDLGQCELAVTGGRGFHIIIPQKVFISKPSSTGYPYLPHIYREMSFVVYVNTMDMRVYSARKGRMWRTYGVQRPNGNYKVQITPAEALAMTPERYAEICSKPRACFNTLPPEFNAEISLLFHQAKDKVDDALTKRAKKKSDPGALKEMRDNLPKSIQDVLDGKNLSEDTGFHQIALQLAMAAHALEWTENELIEKAKGVCETHQSDGHRYNTPAKRRYELRRMWVYMDGNPCYDWSVGGLLSLLNNPKDYKDLDKKVAPVVEADGELEEDELNAMCEGLVVRKSGVYAKYIDKSTGEEKSRQVATFGISDVAELIRLDPQEQIGFEVTVHVGKMATRKRVAANDFDSKVALRRALGSAGHFRVTDAQAGAFQEVFKLMSDKAKRKMVSIGTEGVNIILEPGSDRHVVWWIDNKEPFCFAGKDDNPGYRYRFDPIFGTPDACRSDLQNAPYMEDTEENREFMADFFSLFSPSITSKVLGWYASAFLSPFFRHHFGQFPILQSYGEAGGGKTSFNVLCANLHFHRNAKGMKPISAASTPFAIEAPLAVSSSVPCLYDEVKPKEMAPRTLNMFYMLVRNNYNGNSGAKGRINRDSGVATLGVEATRNVAPLAFMSEQRIDQEAILHRCVLAAFPEVQTAREGTRRFMRVESQAWRLGQLGRILLDMSLRLNVEKFAERFLEVQEELINQAAASGETIASRPLFNLSVVVLGLHMVKAALNSVFGDRFDAQMKALAEEITIRPQAHAIRSMSEINRVLSDIAALTDSSRGDSIMLIKDLHWRRATTVDGVETVEILVRSCWDSYARMCKSQGVNTLFDRDSQFIDALYRHKAVVDRTCQGSPLKRGRNLAQVVALDVRILADEGIEDFAT